MELAQQDALAVRVGRPACHNGRDKQPGQTLPPHYRGQKRQAARHETPLYKKEQGGGVKQVVQRGKHREAE